MQLCTDQVGGGLGACSPKNFHSKDCDLFLSPVFNKASSARKMKIVSSKQILKREYHAQLRTLHSYVSAHLDRASWARIIYYVTMEKYTALMGDPAFKELKEMNFINMLFIPSFCSLFTYLQRYVKHLCWCMFVLFQRLRWI